MVMDACRCSKCGGAVTARGQWQCHDCKAVMESCEIERIQEVRRFKPKKLVVLILHLFTPCML